MAKKLSDAQIKALNEIHELGHTNARKNTLESVVQYITSDNSGDEPRLILNTDGREVMGLTDMPEVTQTQEEIELDEEFWASEDGQDFGSEVEAVKEMVETTFDKFDSKWNALFKETAGFGETLNWKGVEVWDGLTAAEIWEDMETATPINRKARRTHFRTLRNAYRRRSTKQLKDANPSYTRKALKITGAVGL